MAKTNIEYPQVVCLKGKVKWARVFEQNRDKTGPNGVWKDDGGRYTITVVLDEIEQQKLTDVKSQKKRKEDDDGDMVIRVDRKHNPPVNKQTGETYDLYGGPPQVRHADKTPWDIDEDGLIGNGSLCNVFVTVYEAGGLVGTRLEAVQVLDHVVYESERGEYDPTNYLGMKDETSGKKPPKKTKVEDLDDEIPF